MRQIYLKKMVISICVGSDQDELQRAANILQQFTGQIPKYGKAKKYNRGFGIKRNQKISCFVTITDKEKIKELFDRGLKVKEYELRWKCFNDNGCFGFGIDNNIDLGMRYSPKDGQFGMNFMCQLTRNGVGKRKRKQGKKVGLKQRVTREDAIRWFCDEFEGIPPWYWFDLF